MPQDPAEQEPHEEQQDEEARLNVHGGGEEGFHDWFNKVEKLHGQYLSHRRPHASLRGRLQADLAVLVSHEKGCMHCSWCTTGVPST
jgi:hypothetical protein